MLKKVGLNVIIGLVGIALGSLLFRNSNADSDKIEDIQQFGSSRWTCSMHPHIDGQEGGTCPLCGMDLVMSSSETFDDSNYLTMSNEAIALSNIETITVGSFENEESELVISGEITTNEETDAVQTTLFDGRLDNFFKNVVGDRVRKGEKIAEIYSPQLYPGQDKLIETKIHRESHRNLFDAARNTSGVWKLSDAQIEEILESEVPLLTFPIASEFNGEIVEVYAEKGGFYKEGAPLYKVSNLRTVWAVLDAYEHQLPLLKVGDKVILSGPGLKNGSLEAKINVIEPRFNGNHRTVDVRVVLDNSDRTLIPGMFVNAKIGVGKNDGLTIPKSAVIWTGKRSIVYRKPEPTEPIFELVEIELGMSYENSYEVVDGLSHGDEIVYHGAFAVDAAAQLNGKDSMINWSKKVENNTTKKKGHLIDTELKDINLKEVQADASVLEMLETYYSFKDALVLGDFENAKKTLKRLDIKWSEAKNTNAGLNKLEGELNRIKNSKDLSSLRANFKLFNAMLIEIIRGIKGFNGEVFVQFCPMADNNKGAFWLSNEEQISNPYFGNQMLRCGVVKEVLN